MFLHWELQLWENIIYVAAGQATNACSLYLVCVCATVMLQNKTQLGINAHVMQLWLAKVKQLHNTLKLHLSSPAAGRKTVKADLTSASPSYTTEPFHASLHRDRDISLSL